MNEEEAMLLHDWRENLLGQGLSKSTVRQYHYSVLRLESEADVALCQITEAHIMSFLASLGTKAHSRQLYVRGIKSFFTWAYERGHIKENPAAHLRPKAPVDPPPDAYSPDEIATLVRAASNRDARYGNAILACYALGLRRSELCGIRPEDVDWQGRRVFVKDAKGNRPRWVEANDLALGALRALVRPLPDGYSLVGFHCQWFTMIVNRAAKDAGLPPNRRRAHMLRASFVTELLGAGVPVSVASRLVGHANMATTHRYAAVRPEDRRRAVDVLPLPVGR